MWGRASLPLPDSPAPGPRGSRPQPRTQPQPRPFPTGPDPQPNVYLPPLLLTETCSLLPPSCTGWLAKIELSNQGEFDTLLNAEAYKAHCEGDAETS